VPPITAWQALSQAGIRYIIIHLSMTSADQLQRYRAILDRPPIYTDQLVEAYAAAP
jgi:hypothetical protein